MTQYIDKSVVVAEIERRRKLVSDPILSGDDLMIGERNALFNLLSFINTLEVKEVDSDKCEDGYEQGHADAHPRWISVEDELPRKESEYGDDSIAVLATDGNGVYKGVYRSGEHLSGWFSNYWRLDNISHWMPLPVPPARLSNMERTGKEARKEK